MNTTAAPTKATVKRYMLNNYRDHVDHLTNELNLTALVEDADYYFTGLDTSSEADVWDWAVEVCDILERAGKVAPIC